MAEKDARGAGEGRKGQSPEAFRRPAQRLPLRDVCRLAVVHAATARCLVHLLRYFEKKQSKQCPPGVRLMLTACSRLCYKRPGGWARAHQRRLPACLPAAAGSMQGQPCGVHTRPAAGDRRAAQAGWRAGASAARQGCSLAPSRRSLEELEQQAVLQGG